MCTTQVATDLPPRRPGKGRPRRGKHRDPTSLLADAVGLHQSGSLAEARTLYRRILRSDPDNANALHLLGLLCLALGDSQGAERRISRAISVDPRPADFHNSLGVVLLKETRNDEARTAFAAAVERNPSHAEALNNMGNTLQNLGNFDDALAYYRRAIQARVDYEEAHYNMGRALEFLRLGQQALLEFKRALEIAPITSRRSEPSAACCLVKGIFRAARQRQLTPMRLPASCEN